MLSIKTISSKSSSGLFTNIIHKAGPFTLHKILVSTKYHPTKYCSHLSRTTMATLAVILQLLAAIIFFNVKVQRRHHRRHQRSIFRLLFQMLHCHQQRQTIFIIWLRVQILRWLCHQGRQSVFIIWRLVRMLRLLYHQRRQPSNDKTIAQLLVK